MDIITATAIMMATMNGFSANEQTVVNPVIEGNVVTSVEVMERQAGSDLLTLKCKEFYAYDDDERLVQKEVWTWNSNNMEFRFTEFCLVSSKLHSSFRNYFITDFMGGINASLI